MCIFPHHMSHIKVRAEVEKVREKLIELQQQLQVLTSTSDETSAQVHGTLTTTSDQPTMKSKPPPPPPQFKDPVTSSSQIEGTRSTSNQTPPPPAIVSVDEYDDL
jgi:hypothetical protein